jgi:hypothetical protein
MNGSRSSRQAVLLALLARIKQAAPKDRPALRAELAALVTSYEVIDGARSAPKPTRREKKVTR